jgi:hypothetical protein
MPSGNNSSYLAMSLIPGLRSDEILFKFVIVNPSCCAEQDQTEQPSPRMGLEEV